MIARCLLAPVLVAAGVLKLWDPVAFADGLEVECSCFGSSPLFRLSTQGGLLRAAALLVLALWVDWRLRHGLRDAQAG